jgi:hypothetical protein
VWLGFNIVSFFFKVKPAQSTVQSSQQKKTFKEILKEVQDKKVKADQKTQRQPQQQQKAQQAKEKAKQGQGQLNTQKVNALLQKTIMKKDKQEKKRIRKGRTIPIKRSRNEISDELSRRVNELGDKEEWDALIQVVKRELRKRPGSHWLLTQMASAYYEKRITIRLLSLLLKRLADKKIVR